jgi:hypothetical protein
VAIAIPSDLILDVIRNAAPARTPSRPSREAPVDTAAGDRSVEFGSILHASAPLADPADDLILGVIKAADSSKLAAVEAGLSGAARSTSQYNPALRGVAENSPQKSFEQMFIRNMLESMLPAADSGIYGDEGASSGVWRSLAADQLATAYTNAGGLGIASGMLKSGSGDGMVSGPQWPYFIQSEITSYSG